MNEREEFLVEIVSLNKKPIVGKTRLQKTVYLLQELDFNIGFEFSYHHYGPYSEGLSNAIFNIVFDKRITENKDTSEFGNKIFSYTTDITPPSTTDKRSDILELLSEYTSIELELSATAVFLDRHGFNGSAWAETKRRKAGKASDIRMENASKLLESLNLTVQ